MMNIGKVALVLLSCFAAAAHAAQPIPTSCEVMARFFGECGTEMQRINSQLGQPPVNTPSAFAVRSGARDKLRQLGDEKTDKLCMNALENLQGNFATMVTAAGMGGLRFSSECQHAMVNVMDVVKNAADSARAASNSAALNAPAMQTEITNHEANAAVQWAELMRAQGFNSGAAFKYAKVALADVQRSCPDAVAIFPVGGTSRGPTDLIVSKHCGYAVSYWDDDETTQVSFDADTIDGWYSYCAAHAGTYNECAAHP